MTQEFEQATSEILHRVDWNVQGDDGEFIGYRYIEKAVSLAAQVKATVLLAQQVKRIADLLEGLAILQNG